MVSIKSDSLSAKVDIIWCRGRARARIPLMPALMLIDLPSIIRRMRYRLMLEVAAGIRLRADAPPSRFSDTHQQMMIFLSPHWPRFDAKKSHFGQ